MQNIRVWDKEYKNWRELPDLFGDYQAHAYRTYGEPFSIFSFFNADAQDGIKSGELIVDFGSGIKDDNGVEIFEHDIIEIKFMNETSAGKIKEEIIFKDGSFRGKTGGRYLMSFNGVKIVGNSHES